MLTVVCFKWGEKYTAEHVNVLESMVDRHLSVEHEFVCATDDARGLDPAIRCAPVEASLIPLGNAYPKLAVFRPDAEAVFGRRILLIDLDCVVLGSLDPLVDRSEDFVVWRDPAMRNNPERFRYNTSMLLLTAGARSKVWDTFDPVESRRVIRAKRLCGSDQAWVSHVLPDEAVWTERDGVLSFKADCKSDPRNAPKGARIVFFHGKPKPWARLSGWVEQHWR